MTPTALSPFHDTKQFSFSILNSLFSLFYFILSREQQCQWKAWDNTWNEINGLKKVNITLLNITEYFLLRIISIQAVILNAIKHNTWFEIWWKRHRAENVHDFQKEKEKM